VAVLCNFPTSGPGALAQRVADIYLEGEFPEPRPQGQTGGEAEAEPVPLTGEDLAALTGHYLRDGSDIPVSLQIREGRLARGRVPLLHLGDWAFSLPGLGGTLHFAEGEDGSVVLSYPGGETYLRHPSVEPTPAELAAFVGRYWSDELAVEYEIRMGEEGLVYFNRKLGQRNLTPTFRDGFMFGGGPSATFTRDVGGRPDGFTMSAGRVWKVRFRRMDRPNPR